MPGLPYVCTALLALALPGGVLAVEPGFMTDVAPVLVARCAGCHGPQKARGEYRLHAFDELLKPGASSAAPVVPGKPEESELYRRLVATEERDRMPPGEDPLTPAEIARVRAWIVAGGKFDGPDRRVMLRSILPPRKHPAALEKYPTPAPVFALAFSPDGKELVTGGVNEVLVWAAATGKLHRRLPGLPARIHSLAYSTDGTRLLVGGGTPGEYGEVALIDSATGKLERVFGTFDDVVLAAAFTVDGKTIAAGGADRAVRGYRVADGALLWSSSLHSDWVTGVAFSPDGKWVATSSKDRTVKVLEAPTGKLFTTFNGHRRQYAPHVGQFEVYAVAFDVAGTAYSVGGGAAVRAWDPVKTQQESGSAADMEDRFKSAGHTRYLEFPAGKPAFKLVVADGQVFSAGGNRIVHQHDAASGKLIREYVGHTDWVYALTVHPGTGRLASGAFDGEVRVWDTKTGSSVMTFQAAPGWVK